MVYRPPSVAPVPCALVECRHWATESSSFLVSIRRGEPMADARWDLVKSIS